MPIVSLIRFHSETETHSKTLVDVETFYRFLSIRKPIEKFDSKSTPDADVIASLCLEIFLVTSFFTPVPRTSRLKVKSDVILNSANSTLFNRVYC